MTQAIDQGHILHQRLFPLSPDETAFSLNAKCYAAGIESFAELVEQLTTNSVEPQPQALEKQHYYGRHKRPPAACLLDWQQSAMKLAALVRGLDFGSYENPLGRPKLFINGQPFSVGQAEAVESTHRAAPVGTITALEARFVEVQCADQSALRLRHVSRLTGERLEVQTLVTQFGLEVGQRLEALTPERAARLTDLNRKLCRHESYWVKRLAELQPADIPYSTQIGPDSPTSPIESVSIETPSPLHEFQQSRGPSLSRPISTHSIYEIPPASVSPELVARCQATVADVLAVAWATFLARLSQQYTLDVGYSNPEIKATIAEHASLFATYLPLRLKLDPQADFVTHMAIFQAAETACTHHLSYAHDVFLRYPQLTAPPMSLPLVIERSSGEGQDDLPPDSTLTLIVDRQTDNARWVYQPDRLAPEIFERLRTQFMTFLDNVAAQPQTPLQQIPLVSQAERTRLLLTWNETTTPYPQEACIHQLIEQQVAQTPAAIALAFRQETLTYQQLDERANQLAHYLQQQNVRPETLVGIYMERSVEMMVALLATLKAGAAYVPLDPTYPPERIAWMVEDSELALILTQQQWVEALPAQQAETTLINIDQDWPMIDPLPTTPPQSAVTADNLCYVIYTSGSTGKPKGVMLTHRNVVNFFVGMDAQIPHDPPGVWLAVTSLSFDISVLELFWTLARGFKVVLYADSLRAKSPRITARKSSDKPVDFSLFYFASEEHQEAAAEKYHLLLEGAKFADANGFAAIWTPERHFHAFGGLYPNPAVTSAALAAITQNVRLRAGSCVLPIHHPVRVAEEWAFVDNISHGRVGISFAAGWQPNDFIFRPEQYAARKEIMFRDIEQVRQLWRGEAVMLPGPTDNQVEIRSLPRPIQPELPVWVTAAGNPETFRQAGQLGYNLLTHLLGQSVDELAEKIQIYRQAYQEAGHAGSGHISLMLHTFVGDSEAMVRETVRQPMIDYLKSSVSLIKAAAWHFPTFKQRAESTGQTPLDMLESDSLTEEDMDALLAYAFSRYYETSGLFGTPEQCLAMVDTLQAIGVDEIACLVDFGVASQTALKHLHHLNRLKTLAQQPTDDSGLDDSIPALIERHQVTHFQCTPSMASMLSVDPATLTAFQSLQVMLVGGEAFPVALAATLQQAVSGRVINMYGPTETTIWSTTHHLDGVEQTVPIGRPIANTHIYILDDAMQPVPVGLAGHLWIGGHGVARGYLKRPELTAERFIADPFQAAGEARLYRTGDLARYRPDGLIEFLGRSDFQVKVRGYRIELGEIETLLTRHPALHEAVVIAREDTLGDQRLVAYVIPLAGETVSANVLRDYLTPHLPEFMLPAHVVSLDRFPLTPNKKVNRPALPKPEQAATALPTTYVPPSDDMQQSISSIWQELLNLPQIGIHDNFFELGGHSLLAVQSHRRLSQTLAVPLSIADIFQYPTVHALAAHLNQTAQSESGTSAPPPTNRAQARREAMQRRRRRR